GGDGAARDGMAVSARRIEAAIGMRARRDIVPYPPGIPIALKGEVIGEWEAGRIEAAVSAGAHVSGVRVGPGGIWVEFG
ncbi:MAG: hypothetical protein FWE70_06270, partial [Oscillospiraceae bacterium]|nr:hypothetical protein [Oscillospiraceae bacterium]